VSAAIRSAILKQWAARYSDETYAGPRGLSKKQSCEARERDSARRSRVTIFLLKPQGFAPAASLLPAAGEVELPFDCRQ